MQATPTAAEAQRITELLAQGIAQASAGQLDAAEATGHAASKLAQACGDAISYARALRRLAHVALLRGDYLNSEQRLGEALGIALAQSDHQNACSCYYGFARQLQLIGRLAEAEDMLDKALVQAQRTGLPDYLGMVYMQHAVCKQWLGCYADQLSYSETALELFLGTSDYDSAFFTLVMAADAADHLGQRELAGQHLATAAAMRDRPAYANVMCGAAAEACLRRLSGGDEGEAAAWLSRAEELFDAGCDFDTEILLNLARGRMYAAQGALERAETALDAGLRQAQAHKSRCHIAWARLERVHVLVALSRLEHAQSSLIDAELGFEQTGSQMNLGRVQCAWAACYRATGNRAAAQAALARAEAIALKLAPGCGLYLAGDLAAARAASDKLGVG